MAKLASSVRTNATHPIRTTGETLRGFEGSKAFKRDAKSELLILGLTNMVQEDTFYEDSITRDNRFKDLVHETTKQDPEWTRNFITWLRTEANMRSAPVVACAEYIKAGGKNGRELIKNTLTRADEPAELLGYWLANYGRSLPWGLRKGLADSACKLYTQKSMLKYNSKKHDVRPADVIELCHPKGLDAQQSDLFRWLLDDRHNRDNEIPESLTMLRKEQAIRRAVAAGEMKIDDLTPEELKEAGITHERLSGMTSMNAKNWEKQIPSMGLFALLKNLRNFDEKGINEQAQEIVREKLQNPIDIKGSRVFPFRYLSAYNANKTHNWSLALEKGLDASCANIPELPGRTLVLVDVSGSMNNPVTRKNTNKWASKGESLTPIERYVVGALFAGALAKRCENVDVVAFGTRSEVVPIGKSDSVLRFINKVAEIQHSERLDHATFAYTALKTHYKNHDRVVIFTDEQVTDGQSRRYTSGSWSEQTDTSNGIAASVPTIFTFNLAGYTGAMMEGGQKGRYTLGGFNDATFKVMAALDHQKSGTWPWDVVG